MNFKISLKFLFLSRRVSCNINLYWEKSSLISAELENCYIKFHLSRSCLSTLLQFKESYKGTPRGQAIRVPMGTSTTREWRLYVKSLQLLMWSSFKVSCLGYPYRSFWKKTHRNVHFEKFSLSSYDLILKIYSSSQKFSKGILYSPLIFLENPKQ
jgi:hypothetical protein